MRIAMRSSEAAAAKPIGWATGSRSALSKRRRSPAHYGSSLCPKALGAQPDAVAARDRASRPASRQPAIGVRIGAAGNEGAHALRPLRRNRPDEPLRPTKDGGGAGPDAPYVGAEGRGKVILV